MRLCRGCRNGDLSSLTELRQSRFGLLRFLARGIQTNHFFIQLLGVRNIHLAFLEFCRFQQVLRLVLLHRQAVDHLHQHVHFADADELPVAGDTTPIRRRTAR